MQATTKKLTLSAMMLALALVLPYLTGNNYRLGSMLLLMHIPVLLCGFSCGWQWGLIVGAVAPLLRSVLIGAPPMMPTALTMAFELAAYGVVAGILYNRLPKSTPNLYISLLVSMVLGRLVWGLVSFVVYSLFLTNAFTLPMFFTGAFLNAWPGILLQLALIPPLVLALKRLNMIAQ